MSQAKEYPIRQRAPISLGAVLAVLLGVGSMVASWVGHVRVGLGVGIVAVLLGLAGIGGRGRRNVASIVGVGVGVVAVGWAIAVIVFRL
ncbi:MAG: hypothetical protein ACM359_20090 [Bacillota bacterium]